MASRNNLAMEVLLKTELRSVVTDQRELLDHEKEISFRSTLTTASPSYLGTGLGHFILQSP